MKSDIITKTINAMNDLQMGDHFSEALAYHIIVVYRYADEIAWCEAAGPCTLPQDGKFYVGTLKEFKKRCSYNDDSGYIFYLYGRDINVESWMPDEIVEQLENFDGELAPFGVI